MEHDNSTDNMNDLQAAGKNAAKRAGAAREQLDYSVECTRDCIKEHPLQSVGYAAGLGFLLGLLLTRR